MSFELMQNKYSCAVFAAAFEYLNDLMMFDPRLKRIHMQCYVDEEHENMMTYSIGNNACGNLQFTDDGISFNASFGGKRQDIMVPWTDVINIYCPELSTIYTPNIHDPFGLVLMAKQAYEEAGVNPNSIQQPIVSAEPKPKTKLRIVE